VVLSLQLILNTFAAKLMGLEENDTKWFFPRIREEYRKLLPEKKRGWQPILYVGTRY